MKNKKTTKKYGYIAAGLAVITAIAHAIHFPVLLLAFFGLVGTGLADSMLFKIIAGLVSIMSIIVLIHLYKKERNCDACFVEKTTKITCPKCSHTQEEKIPNTKCQPFYVCNSCKETIGVPSESKNCCVFCEYTEDKCPVANH